MYPLRLLPISNMTLRYRLVLIAALIVASVWALLPRPVVERVDAGNGVIRFDTTKRFPIQEGLDLKGGMHLTLEVDQSKGSCCKYERRDRPCAQGHSDAH